VTKYRCHMVHDCDDTINSTDDFSNCELPHGIFLNFKRTFEEDCYERGSPLRSFQTKHTLRTLSGTKKIQERKTKSTITR